MTRHEQLPLRNPTLLTIGLAVCALCLCAIWVLPGGARAWLPPPPILADIEPLPSQADALAPFRIVTHEPVRNEVGIALSAAISATFDGDLDMGTVTNDTFVLHGHLGGLASGTFHHGPGDRTLRLDPDRAFHAGEVVRVSATSGIWSAGGAALMPNGWQFTAGDVYSRCVAGFTDIDAGLAGVDYSSAAWGDVDNDGDLDILLTGRSHAPPYRVSTVYRNDGNGGFTDIGAALQGVRYSSAAWGDYDNDGDLDILLTGQGEGDHPVASVYRNDGGGVFADIDAGLIGVQFASVAWGDYDNDGDLDILLAGEESSGFYVSRVYRNDGASGFTDIVARLEGVASGSVAWGDYDNDGDLDILLTGHSAYGRLTRVYRNGGDDTFSNIYADLTAMEMSSAAWGDVDNDGHLDILLTGTDDTLTARSIVYRYEGGGVFADIGAGLPGVSGGSVAWGDFDNDGDLDILLAGQGDSDEPLTKVYRNAGGASPAFTDIDAGLIGVQFGLIAWGDVDNDGDLDILIAGEDGSRAAVSKVYRNEECPRVVAHGPRAHAMAVPVTTAITASFNVDVDPGTVNHRSFSVHGNMGSSISGAFAYDAGIRTLTLDPDRAFYPGEVLRVSATSAIASPTGGSLIGYGWQFTAGPAVQRCFAGFTGIGAGLTGVQDGSVAWGDYDNDGDLDILLTGSGWSRVYRNDGTTTPVFTDIGAGLIGVSSSSVAWGDVDNDEDLDILLTGWTGSTRVSKVYRNDGGASGFTDICAGLTGVSEGSVAWGDVDNDGDLDILLTGEIRSYPSQKASKVYRNDGDGVFTDIGAGLTGVRLSSVAWGDYDNDGDLDILLMGLSSGGAVSKVYRNDTPSGFTDIGAALTRVQGGSAAWGDYDNDGDLDILLTGSYFSNVYRNDGGGVFTDIGAGLTGVQDGSAAWGDYDNDGDLDILLTGYTAGPRVSIVYRNDGGGVFTDAGAGLAGVIHSSVAWGDYDNDGDLDILVTGSEGGGPMCKVYRNEDCLDIVAHGPQAHAVGVPLTAAITATFNGEIDVSTVTGRTLAVHGNLGSSLNGTLSYEAWRRTLILFPNRGFHAGETLRVSGASAISRPTGGRLTAYGWQFTAGPVLQRCFSGFTDTGAGLTGVQDGSVAWGDYDSDGDLDILLTGRTGSTRVSRVYRNEGTSVPVFTDIGAGLTGVDSAAVAWGDVDNDEDLDILLTGWTGSTRVSKVYRNDGGASGFTEISADLTGVDHGSVAWGDYDNDGDLDLLLTGEISTSPTDLVSKVYRNDGDGVFIDIAAGLVGVRSSSVAWGDCDNDGDLDILLTGWTGGNHVSKVYRNDGGEAFTDIAAGLAGVEHSSVAWGDCDNDGDLDILLTGYTGSARVSLAYRNDGGASGFTDIGAGLTGVSGGSAAWGDVDNDGDLDILLTGDTGGPRVSLVYRNDGGQVFTNTGTALAGVSHSSAAWGDYDNDGDLDILLTGSDGSGPVSKVYRNEDCLDIVAHGPQAHAIGVAPTAEISATFNADVDVSTVTGRTFAAHGSMGSSISGAFAYDSGTFSLTLDPERAFYAGEDLRISATGSMRNTNGDPLTPYGWQFTAGPVVARRPAGFVDIGAGLTGVELGSVAWGDYDSDGHLDILLTGWADYEPVSLVYRNYGGAMFWDIRAGLTGVDESSASWGDYDNDGDLDILLTGSTGSGPVCMVYRNDGSGNFTDAGAGLAVVFGASAAWGDADNDGDLDILLTGWESGTGRISRVYRNDTPSGAGFTDIGAGLTGVHEGSVAWGDYDNDGDLDILLTGAKGGYWSPRPVSLVYRNDGGASGFSDTSARLTGVWYSSAAWGDYDNDGDLDIVLAGADSADDAVSKVYRNDGRRVFTAIGAGLTGVESGSVAWGDYDNDGALDILLSGFRDVRPYAVSRVYRNDGGGAFTDIDVPFTDVGGKSAAWGDYDNDGDLDVLVTGYDSSYNTVSTVYRNNSMPNLGSLTPSSGSGPVGALTYFTTTWSDSDGWQDLKQCYFHIGDSPALAGSVTLLYHARQDKLWLRSDDGTAWTGGYAPGSASTLENSQAIVHCDLTTVHASGDTLSVSWAIEFKPAYTGTKKLGLKCKDVDKATAKGQWKGTWTIGE